VSELFFADDASLLPWKFIPILAHKIHFLHGCNKQENGDKHEEFLLGVQRILSEWKAKGSFCLRTRGLFHSSVPLGDLDHLKSLLRIFLIHV
jgi:hypothetical protein